MVDREVCTRCKSYKRVPSGSGCTYGWCSSYLFLKGCTCDTKDPTICDVCLEKVKKQEQSEKEYDELTARLVDCWCGERPDVFSRCESNGRETKVIYSYVHCDACHNTGHNTMPNDAYTIDDVCDHWNKIGWKGK